ncbi:MAG: head GIN domain-containing protein [Bacteroidota bacterium]
MRILKIALTLFIVSLATVLIAQSENRDVREFEAIKASQAIDVYLKPGSKEAVKVEARGIDLDEVLTEVSGGRLKIYLDDGRHRNHTVKVYVTFVKLEDISASSAATIISNGTIKGDRLDLSVSSAADIEIDVDVDEIDASASSAGDIELSGSAKYINASASSAGGVDAYDLEAKQVRARASSGGGVKVFATDEIDARASSGGSIRYRGNPARSQTDSGSGGSVRRSN